MAGVCARIILEIALLLVLLSAAQQHTFGQGIGIMDRCPPNEIPASSNVTDLTELAFWGQVADGRVWFVEFYADWCGGCKRIASHVSRLADSLAETHQHIAVGRLNCGGRAERFCDQVIGLTRTPSFKVYYQGKKAIDYNAEFFFYDMMLPFITETAANLKGFSLPGSEPRLQHDGDSNEEEDDDYE